MRNVVKGFQASHLAVPKLHVSKINKAFDVHHAPTLKRPALRQEYGSKTPKTAKHFLGKVPGSKL